MSAVLAKLRKRAAEFEQKKQFDKALEVYIQILDEGGKDLGDEDVPLFNRVGDMLMRKGTVTEALGYYERAVDLYAERGFLNNAIALCSKILRQSPGRAAVYYKLGRISARKGFKSDARKNFLEYADRMQKAGQADEAFRALKEFASLYPDQDDVRLVLAELLSKENRKGEALEQLQSLYQKLQSEGRQAEARATIDRMRAIDPSATPGEGSAAAAKNISDLIFLDLSDTEPRRAAPSPASSPQPVSARAPVAPLVPALSGLSLTFMPDDSDVQHPEGFEATAVTPAAPESVPVIRESTPVEPMIDIEPFTEPRHSAANVEAVVPHAELVGDAPDDVELVEEDIPLLENLIPTSSEPLVIVDDLVGPVREQPPLSGSEFADIELEEAPRPALEREHDLSLPGDLPATPDALPSVSTMSPASAAAADDARVAAEEAADIAADVAAREAVHQPLAAVSTPVTPLDADFDLEAAVDLGELAALPDADADSDMADEGPLFGAADLDAPDEEIDETAMFGATDDFLAEPPRFGELEEADAQDHAFPPLFGLEEAGEAPREKELERVPSTDHVPPSPPALHTPRSTLSIGGAEGHLRQRLELEPENWELRRLLGEALLDTGDREGGLYELELAMVGFELDGDIDYAQEVIDEILGVFPASVRHHQKRVEYAVRSRDRSRLTHSYLELADAMFRTGAADKAVAVYSRVLELDGQNERAEFALATLAPDVLARLRGGPSRPDRWTDELVAIDGPITVSADRAPAPAEETAPETVDALEPMDEPATADEFETADEPESADEIETVEHVDSAAAELDASEFAVETAERLPAELEVADETDEVTEELQVGLEAVRPVEPTVEDEVPTQDHVGEPAVEHAVIVDPVRSDESSEEPALAPNGTADYLELPNPVAEPEPPPAPPPARSPTPRAAPTPSRLERVRSMTPVGASDSDFVDLGEWLRQTEPTRSTRMLVEDPKPTGDEQADFEELLRRFKRGVAENVEAEDYDSHYDLGVAYKEMGLVDEAIAQFQKALRGATNRVRAYEALGQCFVEKQQFPIAAALLQRATEVPGSDDQQLVGVLYLLGFATEHMGRPADALPYYLRVFAVDIEFRDIAQRVAATGNPST